MKLEVSCTREETLVFCAWTKVTESSLSRSSIFKTILNVKLWPTRWSSNWSLLYKFCDKISKYPSPYVRTYARNTHTHTHTHTHTQSLSLSQRHSARNLHSACCWQNLYDSGKRLSSNNAHEVIQITNEFYCEGQNTILTRCNVSCLCSVYNDNHRIFIRLYVTFWMTLTFVLVFGGNVYLWPFWWVTMTCRSSLLEVSTADRRKRFDDNAGLRSTDRAVVFKETVRGSNYLEYG